MLNFHNYISLRPFFTRTQILIFRFVILLCTRRMNIQSVWTHPSLQTAAVPIVTSKQRKRMNVLICRIYTVNDVGEDNNETANDVIGHLSSWRFYDSLLQHHNY